MTEREFLTAVLAVEGIAEDVRTHATEGIAKLDAKNSKRKNTQTKTQKENEPIKASIVALLTENGAMVASEIATAIGISTQKASALCKQLVGEGILTEGEVKVKNKGTVKQYSVAEGGDGGEDATEPTED
jgi:DNA-binding Lrp family transcriptional regulator